MCVCVCVYVCVCIYRVRDMFAVCNGVVERDTHDICVQWVEGGGGDKRERERRR